MTKTLSVAAIKEGTVIDHIPAGSALIIFQLLGLAKDNHRIALGIHLTSSSMGHKDIIKIENRALTKKETHDIAVFAPQATINIVKNYRISSKIAAKLPETVSRILICPNLRCITNNESIDTFFHIEEHKQKILLRCHFCEKLFERSEIKDYHS